MTLPTLAAFLLGFFLLALFGWWYDRLVASLEAAGRDEGLTWLLVVLGVAATLVVMGLVDLVVNVNAGLLGLACFACSGAPMALGAIRRHNHLRARFAAALKELYGHPAAGRE